MVEGCQREMNVVPSVGRSLALSGINRPPFVSDAISFTRTSTLFVMGVSSPSMGMPSILFPISILVTIVERPKAARKPEATQTIDTMIKANKLTTFDI